MSAVNVFLLCFLAVIGFTCAADVAGSSVPALTALKLVSLDATCGPDAIHVTVKFEKPFNGIVYSKGAFYTPDCVFVLPGSGEVDYVWDIPINQCETTETKPAADSKSGERTFENTVVFQVFYLNGSVSGVLVIPVKYTPSRGGLHIAVVETGPLIFSDKPEAQTRYGAKLKLLKHVSYQNDAHFQDIFDVVRRIRCSTAAQYEKIVDFSPINVNMRDVVTASFTGDDVKVSIDVQNGRGPFAPSLNQGFIQIGDTVTLIVYMTAQSGSWDLQVRECVALDSKERASLTLQDEHGCVSKPKIMSSFALTKDRKNPEIMIAYSYMKAFRFPDDMQVQIKCVVAVCRDECQRSACNHTAPASTESPDTTENSDQDDSATDQPATSASRRNTTLQSSRSKTIKPRSAFELPLMAGYLHSSQRQKREFPGESEQAAGTLPLRHIFNVISPEDIASLRNSSVIMVDSAVPANSLCVNQVMFIFLLAFLFVLVISTSMALTLMCLRNKALLRERKTTEQLYGSGYIAARY